MRRKEKQHRRLLSHLLNQPGPPQFQVKRIKHFPPVQPATENKPAGISAAEEFKKRLERAAAAAAAASKGKN